ncbi:MAG TPA: DUF4382 domain-containing protein [Bacteroidales bacterium]|nr:DUF4382 domain-containing protein [Bacteroidales bacterium]
MSTKRISLLFFSALALFAVLTTGCEDKTQNNGSGTLLLYLTDAPATYDAVNIDIQSVQIKTSEGDSVISPDIIHPGVYNLLDLQNGLDTLLGTFTLPAATVSQVRLVLGNNNSIVKDGMTYDLKTPSAQQSGLKLNVHAVIDPAIDYRLWIDFDAKHSVVETGNGKFILKPVIRTYTEGVTGAIEGVLLPPEANPEVNAILGEDTISALPDDAGYYLLKGLNEGSYKLIYTAVAPYLNDTITDVSVLAGQVTKMDTVRLMSAE